MQITKQIAGILYGNGYLLQHVESGEIHSIASANGSFFYCSKKGEICTMITFSKIGTEYKILARPNDLFTPIEINSVELHPSDEIDLWVNQSHDGWESVEYGKINWLQAHNFAVNLNPEWLIYNETIYNT